MSTRETPPTLVPAAAAALVEVLMLRSGYAFWLDPPTLQIHGPREETTRALLAVLEDVTAWEWTGTDSGWLFRTYRGALPCGLLLEVVTFQDEVPDLLAGGAQARLDTPRDDAERGGR